MGVAIVPLRGLETAADQIELPLRRRDAPPGLLLEGVQDVVNAGVKVHHWPA